MSTSLTRRSLLVRGGLLGLAAAAGPSLIAACSSSPASSAKPATLSGLWVPYDPLIDASKAAATSWEAANGIQFNIATVPWADWDRTVRAFPQQPTVPDVAIVDGPALLGYAANDILLPLDRYFNPRDMQDFLPATTASAMRKGSFYGPATNESSQALAYNKDLLDKYGITPPTELSNAWTWPQLHEIMIDIQKRERAARGNDQFWGMFLGQGNFIGGGTYTGLDLIRSKGAKGSNTYKAISDDGLTVTGYADTPEAMEGYQFLQDLYIRDGLTPQSKSPDFFYNGQIAFWLTDPDVAVTGIAEKAPTMKWGVTPHPYFVTPVVQTDSYHLGVPKNSPNADWAAKLVADMVSPTNVLILASKQKAIPMRKSLLDKADYLRDAHMHVFTETASQWAVPRPITPGWSEYDTVYSQMLADIATGADISKTVSKAVSDIDSQLARYQSLVR